MNFKNVILYNNVFLVCGVFFVVFNLDMNILVVGEFILGIVFYFKCNLIFKLDCYYDIERVMMLCLENNVWIICGVENCKLGK